MATKHAAMLKFKAGTSEKDIANALNALKHLLENAPKKAWKEIVTTYDTDISDPVLYFP